MTKVRTSIVKSANKKMTKVRTRIHKMLIMRHATPISVRRKTYHYATSRMLEAQNRMGPKTSMGKLLFSFQTYTYATSRRPEAQNRMGPKTSMGKLLFSFQTYTYATSRRPEAQNRMGPKTSMGKVLFSFQTYTYATSRRPEAQNRMGPKTSMGKVLFSFQTYTYATSRRPEAQNRMGPKTSMGPKFVIARSHFWVWLFALWKFGCSHIWESLFAHLSTFFISVRTLFILLFAYWGYAVRIFVVFCSHFFLLFAYVSTIL